MLTTAWVSLPCPSDPYHNNVEVVHATSITGGVVVVTRCGDCRKIHVFEAKSS